MPRTFRTYLEDIHEAARAVLDHTAALDFDSFRENELVVKAVLYDLAVIGEAARAVPDTVREAHSEIAWRRIIGLRNIITHEYFGVDLVIIWDIVQNHVPALHEQIGQMLAEYS
jgi:uncharacterized protein with HEPN domain